MQILLSTADLCQRRVFIASNRDSQTQISWGRQKDQRPLSLSSPLNLAQFSTCSVSPDTGKSRKTQCRSLPSSSPAAAPTTFLQDRGRHTLTWLMAWAAMTVQSYTAELTLHHHLFTCPGWRICFKAISTVQAGCSCTGGRDRVVWSSTFVLPLGWVSLACFRLMPCTDTWFCHKTTHSTVRLL